MNRPDDATSLSNVDNDASLPEPVITPMRWPFPWIWLVPLAAAIASGVYLYNRHKDRGREIVIEFNDASGVRPEETLVSMRGAQVGQVVAINISPDHEHVQVHVQLLGSDRSIGRKGAKFWIVKPDLSEGKLNGLGTIVTGPYIEASPGDGEETSHFTGMQKPPVMLGDGLRVVLHAERLEKLQVGSEVQFRGMGVGVVQDIRLGSDAAEVNATLLIWHRYAPLVRTNSQFWSVSGADVKGGVLTDVHVKLGSLQTLLSGSVAFATPDDLRDQAPDGAQFRLNSEPKNEWLKWSPHIKLLPEAAPATRETAAE